MITKISYVLYNNKLKATQYVMKQKEKRKYRKRLKQNRINT